MENRSNRADVEKVSFFKFYLHKLIHLLQALDSKCIWPWVKKEDEGYDERKELLLKGGYKEWKPKSKTDGNKWKIKFAIEPKTDTNTSGNSSDSDTTSTDANEEEEEEDDEV